MDGGRILRSVIAFWKSEEEATQIAASAGQFLAVAMGLFGLLLREISCHSICFAGVIHDVPGRPAGRGRGARAFSYQRGPGEGAR